MPDISDYYPLMEKGFAAQAMSSNGLLTAADSYLFPKPGEEASAGTAPNGGPARTPFSEVIATAAAKQEIRVGMVFPAHLIEQPTEHLQVTAQRMGEHPLNLCNTTPLLRKYTRTSRGRMTAPP